jgi:hypothetical protein
MRVKRYCFGKTKSYLFPFHFRNTGVLAMAQDSWETL